MLKKFLNPSSQCCANMACTGKLLIRIAVGFVFIAAGWMKLNNLEMVNGMFESMFGFAWLGTFVALVEFIGGILILVGYQTFASGVLIAIIMLVAIFKAHWADGWIGIQFPFVLMLTSLAIAFIGPGRFSLAKCLCKGKTCNA